MIGVNIDKIVNNFRSELAGMRADIVGVHTDLAPLSAVLDELTMIRQLMEQLVTIEGEKMKAHSSHVRYRPLRIAGSRFRQSGNMCLHCQRPYSSWLIADPCSAVQK